MIKVDFFNFINLILPIFLRFRKMVSRVLCWGVQPGWHRNVSTGIVILSIRMEEFGKSRKNDGSPNLVDTFVIFRKLTNFEFLNDPVYLLGSGF